MSTTRLMLRDNYKPHVARKKQMNTYMYTTITIDYVTSRLSNNSAFTYVYVDNS